MSVFGPKYPPPLQATISHAERFCELVADLQQHRRPRADEGRRWLVRRSQEIVTVLALMVEDWSEGRLGLEDATREIAQYLADLHAGARRSLTLGPVLECCLLEDSVTVVADSSDDSPMRMLLRTGANDTLFDPSALVGAPPGVPLDDLTCELQGSARSLARKPRV